MKEIVNLCINPEWETMGDSMCYDSGTYFLIAKIKTDTCDINVCIRAQGHVKVYYKDNMYKHANQMPQELIDMFRDGTAWTECDVVENNWWEIMWDTNQETNWYERGDVFELLPYDFKNEQEIREWLLQFADYVTETI